MPIDRLGVCSWSLRPNDPAELVASVRASGLEAVQLALTPVVSERDVWVDTVPVLNDAGITVLSGMMAPVGEDYTTLETIEATGGVRPDATWPANEAMARAMAVVAGRAGISLVTLHAGFLPADRAHPEREVMITRLRTLGDIFASEGVRIGFETGQESAQTLLDVLEHLDHDAIGINFDPANMILYGAGDPGEALELLSPHVVQVHIKDALPAETPGTWGTEVPSGRGAVDWSVFFARIDALGRDVNAIIEREAGDARVEDVRQAVTMVQGRSA